MADGVEAAGPVAKDGTWDRLLRAAQSAAYAAGDLESLLSVDSSVVRAHQHATNTVRTGPAAAEVSAQRSPTRGGYAFGNRTMVDEPMVSSLAANPIATPVP